VSPWSVALELPGVVLGPLLCRLRGHRWHVWAMHAAPVLRICVRCGRAD
jgi:hypothetical protein